MYLDCTAEFRGGIDWKEGLASQGLNTYHIAFQKAAKNSQSLIINLLSNTNQLLFMCCFFDGSCQMKAVQKSLS